MGDPAEAQRLAALAVLGLQDPSSQHAITEAYRRLARQTHPDVAGDQRAGLGLSFTDVADAYRILRTSTSAPVSSPTAPSPAPAVKPTVQTRHAPAVDIEVRTAVRRPAIVVGPVHVVPRTERRPGGTA